MQLYDSYFVDRAFERLDIFEALVERFKPQRALYPGSFVHVTPSFVIPSVTYVDTDRRCPRFFGDLAVNEMIQRRKRYAEQAQVILHAQSYLTPLPEPEQSFDLLISQWAGPISQACKRYLKVGGILLANNSHGDASLASADDSFKLNAVFNMRAGKHSISSANLDSYLIPKSGRPVDPAAVAASGRGVAFTRSPAHYVFERVK